ncbi:MAG: hypothetical protein ACJAT5_000786 [Lentimonas sp.]|jgi:hypothetical protein
MKRMKKFGPIAVIAVLLITMFMPMIAIHLFGVNIELQNEAPGEITVGLVVILRATFRRLLRGFSTNILQTTLGTFGRTSARAVTRRFVKFAGRVLFSSIMQESFEKDESSKSNSNLKEPSSIRQVVSLTLGFVGLCLSFWGILHVIPPEHTRALVSSKGLSYFQVAILAGLPLLAYALIHKIFGRIFNVRTTYSTAIDGLLLQAYFTGAGSFLPLTTDVEYHGDKVNKCKLAASSLLGMLAIFVLLYFVGAATGIASLSFLGSMFLVYCFVYCFPIQPLEGYFIWSYNKLAWLAVSLPILFAFINCMDQKFGDIL